MSSWSDQKCMHSSKPWEYELEGLFSLMKEILVGPVSRRPALDIGKARII